MLVRGTHMLSGFVENCGEVMKLTASAIRQTPDYCHGNIGHSPGDPDVWSHAVDNS